MCLNRKVQPSFDEPKHRKDENDRALNNTRTTGPGKASCLCVATAYLRPTGKVKALYTIMGAPVDLPLPDLPLPNMVQRNIRHGVNRTRTRMLNSAFGTSPYSELVDNMYGMHAVQTIYALMSNQAYWP